MDSEQAAALILKGDIELALITLPDAVDKPFTTVPVWSDPMQCVVSRDHVLANRKVVSRTQLAEHGVLLQSHSTHTRDIIDQALKLDDKIKNNHGIKLSGNHQGDDPEQHRLGGVARIDDR